jgi:hypothetical protein
LFQTWLAAAIDDDVSDPGPKQLLWVQSAHLEPVQVGVDVADVGQRGQTHTEGVTEPEKRSHTGIDRALLDADYLRRLTAAASARRSNVHPRACRSRLTRAPINAASAAAASSMQCSRSHC